MAPVHGDDCELGGDRGRVGSAGTGVIAGVGTRGWVSVLFFLRRSAESPRGSSWARTLVFQSWTYWRQMGLPCRALCSWQPHCGAFCLGRSITSVTLGLHTSLSFFLFLLVNRVPCAGHTYIETGPRGVQSWPKIFHIAAPSMRLRARTEVRHPFYRNCPENCFML